MRPRSRVRDRLKARDLELLEPGDHQDGGGLFLRVKTSGARHWLR
jgi:hypothetical protein